MERSPIKYVTLHFREQRGAALLRYRNRPEITLPFVAKLTYEGVLRNSNSGHLGERRVLSRMSQPYSLYDVTVINFWILFSRNMSAAGVEACLKRIQSHKGVVGTIVVNADGIPIKTDLDNANTLQYASACRNLTMLASNTVRDMDPQNELLIVRVSSRKNEMIIAPKEGYHLIVVQTKTEWGYDGSRILECLDNSVVKLENPSEFFILSEIVL